METITGRLQPLFDFIVLEDPSAEVWKTIPGYEDVYEVSNWGRVRSLDRIDAGGHKIKGRIMAAATHREGYKLVGLFKEGERKGYFVHALVALAFIGPRPEGYDINHIDGSRTNNTPGNLEYVTHAENMRHAYRTPRAAIPRPRITEAQATEIKERLKSGKESHQKIASDYGITRAAVTNINTGIRWAQR